MSEQPDILDFRMLVRAHVRAFSATDDARRSTSISACGCAGRVAPSPNKRKLTRGFAATVFLAWTTKKAPAVRLSAVHAEGTSAATGPVARLVLLIIRQRAFRTRHMAYKTEHASYNGAHLLAPISGQTISECPGYLSQRRRSTVTVLVVFSNTLPFKAEN